MKRTFFILTLATIILAQVDSKTSSSRAEIADTLIIRNRDCIDLLVQQGDKRLKTKFFFKAIDKTIFSNNDIKELDKNGAVAVKTTKSTLPVEIFPLVKVQRTYLISYFAVKSFQTSGGSEKTNAKYIILAAPRDNSERGPVEISWWLSVLWVLLPGLIIIAIAARSAGRSTWRIMIFSIINSVGLISVITLSFDNGAILGTLIGVILMTILGTVLGYSAAGDFGLFAGPIAGILSGSITGAYSGLFIYHHVSASVIWDYVWYYLVISALAIIIHLVVTKAKEEEKELYLKDL